MSGYIIFQKYIKRLDLIGNPNIYYLFGDNDMRIGLGGQAKAMRGEPNAIGICVKKKPATNLIAYYNDKEFNENCIKITQDIMKVRKVLDKGHNVVVPSTCYSVSKCSIGCGLANLSSLAPLTFAFLHNSLKSVFDMYKECGK